MRRRKWKKIKSVLFPKLQYDRQVLEELGRKLPKKIRDEMAIPSYLHINPLIRWIIARRMQIVIDLLELKDEQTLLDFGCGTGMLFLQLPSKHCTYYGVDLVIEPAEEMLKRHQRQDVSLFDAECWDNNLPAHSVDSIVALEVLEHVDDVRSLTKLFHNKIKLDGRLIVSCPTENTFYQLGRKIAGFSGDYHNRDISKVFWDIKAEGFIPEVRYDIPLRGPLSAFVIYRFKTKQ